MGNPLGLEEMNRPSRRRDAPQRLSRTAMVLVLFSALIAAAGGRVVPTARADGQMAWTWQYDDVYDQGAPQRLAGFDGAIAIATSSNADHTLALIADGTVRATGANDSGQLGDGTTDARSAPVTVVGLATATAIGANRCASFAVAGGNLWAWGGNYRGNLGDGTTQDRHAPVQLNGPAGVVSVTGGFCHTLALTASGTVWAWGNNLNGQLGLGSTNRTANPTPVQVNNLSNVVAIAAYEELSIALKGDGTVWYWGQGLVNPIQDTTLDGVIAITAQGYALKGDGTIWRTYFGNTNFGPTARVAGIPSMVRIASDGRQLVMVTADGTMWVYGIPFSDNRYRLAKVATVNNLGAISSGAYPIVIAGAVPAAPTLAPNLIFFREQMVGTTSTATTVTLRNPTPNLLSISSIVSTGDFAIAAPAVGQTNACMSILLPNSSCVISVTFTPAATGTRSGTLTVSDDGPGGPRQVSFTGIGQGAPTPLTFSPASLTFGSQAVSTTSAEQTATVTNTGLAAVSFGSFATAGDFSLAGSTCGATLAGGASCVVRVTFTPTVYGTRRGALSIATDPATDPATLPLTGSGVGTPALSLDKTSLSFKGAIGAPTQAQGVTVTNTGTGPLTISAIAESTGFPVDTTPNCARTILPGAQCTIFVRFKATSVSQTTGTLTIISNAPNSPHTVSLTGSGPVRGFIFVHGIAEDYRDYEPTKNQTSYFGALRFPLNSHYNLSPSPVTRFVSFQNYEDRGALGSGGCLRRTPSTFQAPTGFPLNLNSGPPTCDSNDDIGVNAILLDQTIQNMVAGGVDRVTIIANSMGGEITRAYFAYAYAAHRPSVANLDAVIFIQGAQQGSYLGRVNQFGAQLLGVNTTTQQLYQFAASYAQTMGVDVNRPALQGLTPGSAMYQFIDNTGFIPTSIYYANVASEIQVEPGVNVWGAQIGLASIPIGDFVLLPGSDDPFAQPFLGGARFVPANSRGARQYILPARVPVAINSGTSVTTLPGLIGPPVTQGQVGQSHLLIDAYINQIAVPNGPTLDQGLLDFIFSLDTVSVP